MFHKDGDERKNSGTFLYVDLETGAACDAAALVTQAAKVIYLSGGG